MTVIFVSRMILFRTYEMGGYHMEQDYFVFYESTFIRLAFLIIYRLLCLGTM